MDKFHLPEDIVEQLLLPRLPPKSLIRFMCVSKSWYNLIKSPSFISKQLSWSKRHNKPSILLRRRNNQCYDMPSYDLLSLVVGDNDDYLVSNVSLPLEGMRTWSRQHLQIAGHCDGIVCLRLCFGNLVLCNPTIKDFKLVPKSCLILPQEEKLVNHHMFPLYNVYEELLGFGYDSKGKDYKVIRCVQYHYQEIYWLKAEVYTMGSNSWRQINWYNPSRLITRASHSKFTQVINSQFFFNEIYYWQVNICYVCCILSFDMSNELFREISFPLLKSNCDVGYYEGESSLSVWKDETSIALIIPWLYRNYLNYDIWLLNNNSSCVWTKHLTITTKQQVEETFSGLIRHLPLVVLWRSDQLLIAEENERVVVSYDLAGNKEQGTKFFKYHLHAQPYYSYHQAVLYVNSLVPVNGGHKLEGIHKSDFYAVEKLNRGYRSKSGYDRKYLQQCTMILGN